MSVTGTSGTGWTCSGTTGICSTTTDLAAYAKAPVLTLTVEATSAGQKTFKATVGGSNDTNTNNNTASDTGTYFVPPTCRSPSRARGPSRWGPTSPMPSR